AAAAGNPALPVGFGERDLPLIGRRERLRSVPQRRQPDIAHGLPGVCACLPYLRHAAWSRPQAHEREPFRPAQHRAIRSAGWWEAVSVTWSPAATPGRRPRPGTVFSWPAERRLTPPVSCMPAFWARHRRCATTGERGRWGRFPPEGGWA